MGPSHPHRPPHQPTCIPSAGTTLVGGELLHSCGAARFVAWGRGPATRGTHNICWAARRKNSRSPYIRHIAGQQTMYPDNAFSLAIVYCLRRPEPLSWFVVTVHSTFGATRRLTATCGFAPSLVQAAATVFAANLGDAFPLPLHTHLRLPLQAVFSDAFAGGRGNPGSPTFGTQADADVDRGNRDDGAPLCETA